MNGLFIDLIKKLVDRVARCLGLSLIDAAAKGDGFDDALERVGNSLRRIDPMFAHGTLDTLAYRTAARRGFKGNSLHSLGIFCANAERTIASLAEASPLNGDGSLA
ncbi:MAG: hypothetical protein AABZ12_02170 [Planctomycetota bacterium]